MISARNLIGTLAVLLLSARLEAFSVCPLAAKSSLGRRATASSLSASAVLPRGRGSSSSAAPSSWMGANRRVRSGALHMAAETVEEVSTVDLEGREFQLEELEDRDVAETSVVLEADGTVTAGATNGPLPLSVRGKWSLEDGKFSMQISREFDASIPYTVARVYTGYVDEVLPATDTMIVTGDIVMDDMEVGFFKMISAPSDILDSLKHLDEKTRRA